MNEKIIQLDTVSGEDISSYWDEDIFERVEFSKEDDWRDKREAALVDDIGIEELMNMSEYPGYTFIVDYNPRLFKHHPKADVVVQAKDGYIE